MWSADLTARGQSAASRSVSQRYPPGWLWSIFIAAQVALAALLTNYTFFFFDDFLFLQQARTQHFGLTYLRESLFEHFSPISRILDTALVHVAPGSFALAHGIQLAIYVAAVIAFAIVVVTVLGNSWSAFVLTGLFGQSVFLMRILHWWTATANTLPATVFMLLAIAGYLRWRLVGSRPWLIVSLVAYFLALADYETAILFPVYLALIALLVLEDSVNPRAWMVRLWHERWAWLCYGGLALAALYNYYEYYYAPVAHPSVRKLLHFLWVALFETFVPALFGLKDPEAPLSSHVIVNVAAVLIAVAVVASTLYLRPRAWRCLVAFIIAFLITMVPIGLNRIATYGVGVGQELDYQQSVQFMFLVLASFAISSRWGGRRAKSDRRLAWMLARRPAPTLMVVMCTVVIAGYSVLYLTSVSAMSDAVWEPRVAHAYVNAFQAGVNRVRALTGHEPNLINHEVPESVQFASVAPFTHYDQFFGMFDRRLRVDQVSDPAYFVTDKGELLPVHFRAWSVGILHSATVSDPDGSDVAPAASASSACVPAVRTVARLHVKLSSPQSTMAQGSGLPYALRVYYRVPVRSAVLILLGHIGALAVDDKFPHVWGPGRGGELAPLGLKTAIDEVAVELPGGACITSLVFGQFSLAGAPVR